MKEKPTRQLLSAPNHGEEAERAMLSVLLNYPNLLPVAQGYVKPYMIMRDSYKIIYEAIEQLSSKQGSFDTIILNKHLSERDPKLISIVITLLNGVFSVNNLDRYCMIIVDSYIKQSLVALFQRYTETVLKGKEDIVDVYDNVRKELDALFNINQSDINRLIQYEQSVLSACINDDNARATIIDNMQPSLFYKDIHKDLFLAIRALHAKSDDVDEESILAIVDKHGLSLSTPEVKNIIKQPYKDWLKYMRFIIDTNNVKVLNNLAMAIIKRDNNDLDVFIQRIGSMVDSMRESLQPQTKVQSSIQKTIKRIQRVNKGVERSYLITGDEILDNVAYISPDNIVVIAGQQGSGKTRWLINLVKQIFVLNKDISVLWFSMEDSDEKIIRCLISSDTNLSDAQLLSRNYTLTDDDLKNIEMSSNKYTNYDIEFVNDSSTMDTICSKFKGFCKERKNRWCLLIIDNFMLIKDISEAVSNTTAIEDQVMAKLKQLRTDTNRDNMTSDIFLVHHLTKEVAQKANKDEGYRPRISNMKGSTRVQDTANIVLLLNNIGQHKDLIREHSKLPDVKCLSKDGSYKSYKRATLMKNMLIVEVAKNRDGEIDDERAISRYLVYFGTMKFNTLKFIP